MKTRSDITHSEVYARFHAIEEGDFYRQIRFIKNNEQRLRELETEEYIEILQAYREALFQTGKYREQLDVADQLVGLSIAHRVYEFEGEDLFFDSLLQKAASHHNLNELEQAEHVLKELVRIKPHHESARLFLIKAMIGQQRQKRTMFMRGLAVALFLISAGIIALDLLVLKPFYENYSTMGMRTYQGLFLGGIGVLLFDELRFRIVGFLKAANCIRDAVKRKDQTKRTDHNRPD